METMKSANDLFKSLKKYVQRHKTSSSTIHHVISQMSASHLKSKHRKYLQSKLHGRYMDERISKETKDYNRVCELSFSYQNRVVNFVYLYKSKTTTRMLVPKKAKHLLWLLITLLDTFTTIKPLERELDIILVDCKFKKKYDIQTLRGDTDVHPLGPWEINSGFTVKYLERPYSYILIYRREEMAKVLIHELIHFMDLDSSNMGRDGLLKEFFGYDETDRSLEINEAYTDTLACYINTYIYHLLTGQSFAELIATEKAHIMNQAVKILNLYGSFAADASSGYIWKPRSPALKERSHAISYYVLKALLFCNLKSFLTMVKSQKYVLHDPTPFVEMIEHELFHHGSLFWKTMKTQYVSFVKNGTRHDTSLRMSSLDIIDVVA